MKNLNSYYFNKILLYFSVSLAIFIMLISFDSIPLLLHNDTSYLAVHTLLESICVLISLLIFATVWNFRFDIKDNLILFNGILFLAIGIVDMLHIFSYQGMPSFFPEEVLHKEDLLSIYGRMLASVGFISSAILMIPKNKIVFNFKQHFTNTVLLVLFGFVMMSTNTAYMNDSVLIPIKTYLKYIIIVINLLTAAILFKKGKYLKEDILYRIILFMVFINFSDITFIFYSYVGDNLSLLGHVLKLIAYYQMYLAVYKDGVLENHLLASTISRLSRNILRPDTTLEQTGDYIAEAFAFHLRKPNRLSFYSKISEDTFMLLSSIGAYSNVIKIGSLSKPIFNVKDFQRPKVFKDLNSLGVPNLIKGAGNEAFDEIRQKINDVMFIPLNSDGELQGFLVAYNFSQKQFDAEDIIAAESIASFCALALMHAKVVAKMHELSFEDSLTKLNNRRFFMEKIKQILYDGKRYNTVFSVAIIDMDGMKFINDNFGHQAGDEALKKVAFFLKESLRQSDVIARLGGDEFGVIVKNSGRAATEEKLNLIQKELQNNTLDECSCVLGISFGVAEFYADSSNSDELIKIADDRMYEQKNIRKQSRGNLKVISKSEE